MVGLDWGGGLVEGVALDTRVQGCHLALVFQQEGEQQGACEQDRLKGGLGQGFQGDGEEEAGIGEGAGKVLRLGGRVGFGIVLEGVYAVVLLGQVLELVPFACLEVLEPLAGTELLAQQLVGCVLDLVLEL